MEIRIRMTVELGSRLVQANRDEGNHRCQFKGRMKMGIELNKWNQPSDKRLFSCPRLVGC